MTKRLRDKAGVFRVDLCLESVLVDEPHAKLPAVVSVADVIKVLIQQLLLACFQAECVVVDIGFVCVLHLLADCLEQLQYWLEFFVFLWLLNIVLIEDVVLAIECFHQERLLCPSLVQPNFNCTDEMLDHSRCLHDILIQNASLINSHQKLNHLRWRDLVCLILHSERTKRCKLLHTLQLTTTWIWT